MQYLELREKLKDFAVFTLPDIRKIEPNFYPARLNEWQKKGHIKKLRRGYYLFSDATLNEKALFLIANKLYSPSYVSFEMALSHYGLIPEGVYLVTSASTKKTANFKTLISEFSYHRVKPSLFFGYGLEQYQGQGYKIAEMEKALLDYLYINSHIATDADFHEWRFNGAEFLAKVDMQKLHAYAEAFHNKRLIVRLETFLTFIRQNP